MIGGRRRSHRKSRRSHRKSSSRRHSRRSHRRSSRRHSRRSHRRSSSRRHRRSHRRHRGGFIDNEKHLMNLTDKDVLDFYAKQVADGIRTPWSERSEVQRRSLLKHLVSTGVLYEIPDNFSLGSVKVRGHTDGSNKGLKWVFENMPMAVITSSSRYPYGRGNTGSKKGLLESLLSKQTASNLNLRQCNSYTDKSGCDTDPFYCTWADNSCKDKTFATPEGYKYAGKAPELPASMRKVSSGKFLSNRGKAIAGLAANSNNIIGDNWSAPAYSSVSSKKCAGKGKFSCALTPGCHMVDKTCVSKGASGGRRRRSHRKSHRSHRKSRRSHRSRRSRRRTSRSKDVSAAKIRYFKKVISQGKGIFGIWHNDITNRWSRLKRGDMELFNSLKK